MSDSRKLIYTNGTTRLYIMGDEPVTSLVVSLMDGERELTMPIADWVDCYDLYDETRVLFANLKDLQERL